MTLYLLWKNNLNPVIISTIEADPTVLPPTFDESIKLQIGRPVKKRFRPRSKFPNAEDSTKSVDILDTTAEPVRLEKFLRKNKTH